MIRPKEADRDGALRIAVLERDENLVARFGQDGPPWVALANPTSRDLFSRRMGCEVYQPEYGIDLSALCTRP